MRMEDCFEEKKKTTVRDMRKGDCQLHTHSLLWILLKSRPWRRCCVRVQNSFRRFIARMMVTAETGKDVHGLVGKKKYNLQKEP